MTAHELRFLAPVIGREQEYELSFTSQQQVPFETHLWYDYRLWVVDLARVLSGRTTLPIMLLDSRQVVRLRIIDIQLFTQQDSFYYHWAMSAKWEPEGATAHDEPSFRWVELGYGGPRSGFTSLKAHTCNCCDFVAQLEAKTESGTTRWFGR